MNKGQQALNIWSAGCSTGEEVYSIALTMAEAALWYPLAWKITATDIDACAIKQAARGIYSLERLEAIPVALKKKSI